MKKFLIAVAALALIASITNASDKFGWNPEKGKKLYISKIKKKLCNKLHVKKFTQAHTQKEWKDLINNGTFVEELKKICPNFDETKFTEEQIANLGDAVINYAKDSYNIPS
jgi:RNA polymerase subunit RPABC4/transcription elongation factor Spt4